jgi:hypothetical protein
MAEPVPACHDFESQTIAASFAVGSILTDEGVAFAVAPFRYANGETTSGGSAQIDGRGYAAGSGRDVNARNVNLHPLLPHAVSVVQMRFGELGGNVNLTINGDSRNVADLRNLHGATVGGADLVVTGVEQGNNFHGLLAATGPIDDFAIGGQELWVDDLCFNPGIVSCGTPDTSGLPTYIYNEALATVLRGVRIDAAASGQLGIAAGYYRIGEFRIWGAPQEKVKTLHILQHYAQYAIGTSTFPRRDEEWVFSVVALDDWQPGARSSLAFDFVGGGFM